MQTVTLGRTGLKVSVAAFGAGGKSKLGQAQGVSRADSVALVQAAIDQGVNFLDTAAVYGTEEIIGESVRGRRDEIIISTKLFISESFSSDKLITGAQLKERVEAGLAKLQTDYIDILHLHGVLPEQYAHCAAEAIPALHDLQKDGKIRFTGITERFAVDTEHTLLTKAVADGLFDVLMVGYNFVNQTALEHILPQATKNGQGTMCMFAVRGPLARLETANAIVEKLIKTGEVNPAHVDRHNPLGFLLEDGVASSMSEAAYRFCRHTPGIDVTMMGTGNSDHLRHNLESIQMGPLPDKAREKLQLIFGDVVVETAEA